MGDDHLRMGPQAGLYAAGLPLPEHDVAFAIAAADPLAVGGEPYLARVTRDRMSGKPLVSCLPEVVGAIHQNLVVEGLCGEIFF